MYSGNLGATHGLVGMTGAARQLGDRGDVHFLIIGDGLGVEEIRAATDGLKNVTLLPPQPWERLRESLATADVAVVSQAPGTEHLSVPSKTYAALATGSAILALTSDDSDLARLVREDGVGSVFRHGDVPGIAAAIEAWADRPELLRPMRERARAVAESRYSHEAVRERLTELLAPCVRRAHGG
jgi:glycosyltransferase involved in cell wall biosynthesis